MIQICTDENAGRTEQKAGDICDDKPDRLFVGFL
jgi:hypothetical protein